MWQFLQVKYMLTIWPSNSICRCYPSEMKAHVSSQTYTWMFITALFWIVKAGNVYVHQCVNGSTFCGIFLMEYFSTIKLNKLLIYTKHRWISGPCAVKEAGQGKLHTVWFPVYEVLEQAKPIYSDRNQIR